jgi:hypothetical protein
LVSDLLALFFVGPLPLPRTPSPPKSKKMMMLSIPMRSLQAKILPAKRRFVQLLLYKFSSPFVLFLT